MSCAGLAQFRSRIISSDWFKKL